MSLLEVPQRGELGGSDNVREWGGGWGMLGGGELIVESCLAVSLGGNWWN